MRWQILLTLFGALLLATLLSYSAFQVTTVLVPERGGVFREGIIGNPQFLNPLRCNVSEADKDWCQLIYRGLTKIDKQGRVQPDISAAWTIENELRYTFQLRPDQFWSDGQRITANDVLYTIGLLQNRQAEVPPELAILWQTVQVEKIDDATVRFSLSEPLAAFPGYASIGLLPEHIWRDRPATEVLGVLNQIPVASGPFRVEQMDAQYVRLTQNPFYNGKSSYLQALELYFYPDYFSLYQAYLDGKIDGVSRILDQNLQEVTARQDLQLFSSEQSEYLCVVFNLKNPNTPFLQEKSVRQAMLYAIDRIHLIETVAANQGIIAHSPFLPENWAYDPNIQQYPFDLERARQLLTEAGWIDSNGDQILDKGGRKLEFQLVTVENSVRQALADTISANLRQIGINVIVTPVSYTGMYNDFLAPRRFDAALVGWDIGGDPDPYPLWHSSQSIGGGSNYGSWENTEADEIMVKAREISNEQERKTLYLRFQEIFADEVPALLLYHPVYTYGVSARVKNVQIDSLNRPAERFTSFADWYVVTKRVPLNQVPANSPPTPPGNTTNPLEAVSQP